MTRTALLLVACLFVLLPTGVLAQEQVGSFRILQSTDPFDDSDRSAILNLGTDLAGKTPSLGWRCMEDGLNVILVLGGYMGGDRSDRVQVRYRFDSNTASSDENWGLFTGRESAYIPMRQVASFTRQALSAKQVVIRVVDPLDRESRTNTFELNQLREALQTLPCARAVLGGG